MKIDPEWLNTPETQMIMNALNNGKEKARFVGGCVRDAILNVDCHDIDIATKLVPTEVQARLEKIGITVHPTGIAHGTVTAVVHGEEYEITTLRKDVDTDGRHATVKFSKSWKDDARRRDFTMNALYASADGTVHDPLGSGLFDCQNKFVTFVGSPDDRIKEDYLRIMRFFRFSAKYSMVIGDQLALEYCINHRHGLIGISVERVWSEIKQIIKISPAMFNSMVVFEMFPKVWGTLQESNAIETNKHDVLQTFMRHLNKRDVDNIERVIISLKMSNSEKQRIRNWYENDKYDRDEWSQMMSYGLDDIAACRSLIHSLYFCGKRSTLDAHLVSTHRPDDMSNKVTKFIEGWEKPTFPLDGNDAISFGLKGKQIGLTLKAIEKHWVDSRFAFTKEALLAKLKSRSLY